MRVTIILAIAVFAFYLYLPCQVLAQTSTPSAKIEDLTANLPDPGVVDVGQSKIIPGSPLYFLKAVKEKIEGFKAKKKPEKLALNLEFLQRRVRETITLVQIKRWDLVEVAMERYRSQINTLNQIAGSDEASKIMIAESVSRHLDVLQRLYGSSSDLRAKGAVLASIEKGEEYNRKLIDTLETGNQQQLIGLVGLSQALTCKFLAGESLSVNLEATREVLQRQVNLCKISIQENLRDQLEDLRKKKV